MRFGSQQTRHCHSIGRYRSLPFAFSPYFTIYASDICSSLTLQKKMQYTQQLAITCPNWSNSFNIKPIQNEHTLLTIHSLEHLKPTTHKNKWSRCTQHIFNVCLCIWSNATNKMLNVHTDFKKHTERYYAFSVPNACILKSYYVPGTDVHDVIACKVNNQRQS